MPPHHASGSFAPSEFPVLVVSTYRDLQFEREHLIRHVFPELETLCMERSVNFIEIDLRWGISGEEVLHGNQILHCLEEIEHRAPFFIGIIGSRYGTVPGVEELERQPELFRRFPVVRDAAARGSSMIELQMVEGALKSSGMAGRILFFVREPLGDIPADEHEEARERLHALRNQILKSEASVEMFSTPEELGRLVRRSLGERLDRLYPPENIEANLERERNAHDAYASVWQRDYRENAEYMRRLEEHIAGDGPPLIISGEPGCGKSALLANESMRYQQAHPDAFIITHYVAATMSSADHLAILRRVMSEIKVRFNPPGDVPADEAQIVEEFPFWLGHITNQRLVLMIDELNKLDEHSRDLSWLPRYFQPNVRVVISTSDEGMLEDLRERQWNELPMNPLSVADIRALMDRSFPEHDSTGTGTTEPMPHEESEDGDGAQDRARRYLDTGGDDLLEAVLDGYERRHGSEMVRDVLSVLAVARRGLTQMELFRMAELERRQLSRLLGDLSSHVIMGGSGLLSICNEKMRDAIRDRYFRNPQMERRAHRAIARYFLEQRTRTAHGILELPWQLEQLGDWEALKSCVADLEVFERLYTDERRYDLVRYWRALAPHYDVAQVYAEAIRDLERKKTDKGEIARIRLDVGNFLALIGQYQDAHCMLTDSGEYFSDVKDGDERDAVRALMELGSLHQTLGNFRDAREAFVRAVEISRIKLPSDDPVVIAALEAMGSFLYAQYHLDRAGDLFKEVIARRERVYGQDDYRLAASYNGLGAVQQARLDYSDAGRLFHRALDISMKAFGSEHPDVARHLNNLGTLYVETGVFERAVEVLKKAYDISAKMLGPEHPETIRTLINLGMTYRRSQDLPNAEKIYRAALEAAEKHFGPGHLFLTSILINLASVIRWMEMEEEACVHFRRALAICRKYFGLDNLDTATAMLNLGAVLKQMGRYEAAEPLYCAGIPIRVGHLGADHRRTLNAIDGYRDLLRCMGRDDEAAEI